MANGKTQSAAKLYTRVNIDECLYTDNFHCGSECVGCGHCESICPAQAIAMKDGHPTWIKKECFMCFGCLRLCPTAAIRYGEADQEESPKQVAKAS